MTLKRPAMVPSAGQGVRPSRPPFLQTRASSAGAARGARGGHTARCPAGAGGYVKNTLSGPRREADDAMFDRVGDGVTDSVVVLPAGVPGRGCLDIVWLGGLWH